MKNKIAVLSTAAVLTLSIAGNTFAAGITFKDLDNVTAKDKITMLQNEGVIAGVADGIFSPDNKVTAAQSIQLFVRAFNLNLDTIRFTKEPKATDYYKNAKDNAWYSQALIISAVNGMNFPADIDPDRNLTKEEYTYHLVKATESYGQLPLINIIPVEIADQDQITIEYSGAIQRALKYGIVKLDADGKFNPKTELSRGDAAEQLYNALEYLKAHPAPSATQSTAPNQKVVINFEGTVASINGNEITLQDGKVVIVDKDTIFSGDPDTSNEVSDEIVVGDFIQGYTQETPDAKEITALRIHKYTF